MVKASRLDRMAPLLRKEISAILLEEVRDPRIGFVTLTDVVISPDLHEAKIYVSVLGSAQEVKRSMEGLEQAARFIRGLLADRLDLRVTPALQFIQDRSLERGSQVLAKLNRLDEVRKAKEAD